MAQQGTVLVISNHDLLGQGLAARLQGLGVHAESVQSSDARATALALRHHPDVVVLETTDEACLERVGRLSPLSRIVDISDSVGLGCPQQALDFDVILDALADLPD
jgi:hypothetical protein